MVSKIIHIDMDAFYASVEQRDNPDLAAKPVVVGGSPAGRGVVAAASYEARKFGIRSAMPASQAIRLCPDAVFIKPRFDVYREISLHIRSIFREFTDLVEPLSLDEAYLDVTENHKNNPSATLIARELKQRIKSETGLIASAGVAPNKFLAKIASDLDKPDGLAVITPEKAQAFIAELPIGKFHGIGKATEAKMHKLGIYTGADLRSWSESELHRHFGKVASFYYTIARGDDPREVKPHRTRKSLGAERTFREDQEDRAWMRNFLSELAGKISDRMKRLKATGKTITLKLRYDDFETITRAASLNHPTDESDEIARTSHQLLEETEAGRRKVRLLGITVSNLDLPGEHKSGQQLELDFTCE